MKYYGFMQMNHGADHVYLFNEEQIKEEIKRGYLKEDDIPTEEEIEKNKLKGCGWDAWELDGYPIGGSNSAPAMISVLESKEEALEYLQRNALGPDLDDPTLVSIAEYYYRIEPDEGCAVELLREAGLNRQELEKKAILEWLDIETQICKTLNIEPKQFYDDEYREIRLSDVDAIDEFKELISGPSSDNDMIFSKATPTQEPEIQIKLPEKMAQNMLRQNDDFRQDELDKVYLVIEKEPDGEIVWNVTDYTNGSTLGIFAYENNDFVKEHIGKIIMSALEEKEQLKTDKEPDVDR